MGFQTQVNLTPAIGLNGDFASGNPRASFPSPEGGFVAGSGGVTVGRFAWVGSDGKTVLNTGTGKPQGFIHREQQAFITTYLAESGSNVPAGQPVTLMNKGDYFATATVNAAVIGQKVFAKLADGTVQTGAAGATISGFIETDFSVSRACLTGELTVITL